MKDYKNLEEKAKKIRKTALDMVYNAKSGHLGGSFSCIDILTALYFGRMNIDSSEPNKSDRDRFIMSKGHASAAIYSTLFEKGYLLEEEMKSYRVLNGNLQGNPDMIRVCGIDMTTGSLGQGLSIASGMALSSKLSDKDYNIYVLVGDGELQEGMVWESAMFASRYKLDNLMVFVDCNGLQINNKTDEVMDIASITKKFTSFGWYVLEIDGHDFDQIFGAFSIFDKIDQKPVVVLSNTIKGKGVSFMENKLEWHSKVPSKEEYKSALEELR